MFFSSWDNLFRTIVIGTIAYAGLVVLLRISGNRTLSKMNSFDLVVTVAFGSTLSTVLINKSVSLVQGLTAIALLVCLQFIITWLSVRSTLVSNIIKTRPTMVLENGRFLREGMVAVRVTEDEIRAAVRQHGWGGIDQVAAVVMEADGSLSVISKQQQGCLDALEGVNRTRAAATGG